MISHEESLIQCDIVKWLQSNGFYFYSIPNEAAGGGRAAMIRMSKLKAMGLRSGVADLCVMMQGKTVYLEVKTKNGRQSESQKDFEAKCKALGHEYHIVRSVEDTKKVLTV